MCLGSWLLRLAWRRRSATSISTVLSIRTSSRRTCFVDDAGHVWLTGFGIASRLPRERQSPAPPEIGCGHPRLHVSGTDRAHESLDGYPQRSLLFGRHFVPDADGRAPVCCRRPFGVGPLPHRTSTGSARGSPRRFPEPLSAIIMRLLAKNAEDRYQTAAGLVADLRRCLVAVADAWPHRFIPAGRGRFVGPVADTGEAVRPGAGG